MDKKTLNYEPDYAVHPGQILEESLEARGLTQTDFARQTGISTKQINLILNGKAPVTPESAIKFERAVGTKASVWVNLNANYQLHKAKKNEETEIKNKIAWAKGFPILELVKRILIPECETEIETVKTLLSFFKTGTIAAWEKQFKDLAVLFRHSPTFKSSPKAISAWLQIGVNTAKQMDINPFDRKKFEEVLKGIRKLTNKNPDIFEQKMKILCAEAGVTLVFVREFKDTHLSGATYWYSKKNILIIMSLRYKKDDHFWFTFFHEAGHVLKHKSSKIIIDGKDLTGSEIEKEANKFAANILIPPTDYKNFIDYTPRITEEAINNFAKKIDIAPGIVVGRLQKEEIIKYSWHNKLKKSFKLVE